MHVRPLLVLMSAALVAGLSAPVLAKESGKDLDAVYAERMALATAHAGEPVERVRSLVDPINYEVLGDHAVLVSQSARRGWLVEVKPDAGCRRLSDWRGIRLDMPFETDLLNATNGYLVGNENLRCKITSLREVDLVAMRADKKARRLASES
jgi:hypothetical protein